MDAERDQRVRSALSGYLRNEKTGVWTPRKRPPAHDYSDGDAVEQRIAAAVSSAKDLSVLSGDLAAHRTDWPSEYHLSPKRANLLRPLSHKLDQLTLEVGCGCGAITRYLGELGGVVVALEGSARRAEIAASRCRDLPNVYVLHELYDDFETTLRFDAVTMIGVYEYCRQFGAGPESERTWLTKSRERLIDHGVFVVAIENKLGLKYFAGIPEDHLGRAMAGLNDIYGAKTAVTFGRVELEQRLRAAGFAATEVAVPLPDYKLPSSVVLPSGAAADPAKFDVAAFARQSVKSDRQYRPPLFSLGQAWSTVAANGLFADLANSFLIVARPDGAPAAFPADVLAHHYSVDRIARFAKQSTFRQRQADIEVQKGLLAGGGASSNDGDYRLDLSDERYIPGIVWQDELERRLIRRRWSLADIESWLRVWLTALEKLVASKGHTMVMAADAKLPGFAFDAVPRNLIVGKDGAAAFFDLEWSGPEVELGFVLYRAIVTSCGPIGGVARSADRSLRNVSRLTLAASQALGLPITRAQLRRYVELDQDIANRITGQSDHVRWRKFCSRMLPALVDVDGLMKQRRRAEKNPLSRESLSKYRESAKALFEDMLRRIKG